MSMTEDYRVYYSGKYFGLHGYSENDAFLGKPNINDYNSELSLFILL